MKNLIFIFYFFSTAAAAISQYSINLGYYDSNLNLPFGLPANISFTDSRNIGDSKKFVNFTINTNSPFTVIFNAGIEDTSNFKQISLGGHSPVYVLGEWRESMI